MTAPHLELSDDLASVYLFDSDGNDVWRAGLAAAARLVPDDLLPEYAALLDVVRDAEEAGAAYGDEADHLWSRR